MEQGDPQKARSVPRYNYCLGFIFVGNGILLQKHCLPMFLIQNIACAGKRRESKPFALLARPIEFHKMKANLVDF